MKDIIDFNKVIWPPSVDSPQFDSFLNQIEHTMRAKPTDSKDGIEMDYNKIDNDLQQFNNYNTHMTMQDRLQSFIKFKQKDLTTALTPEKLAGFEQFPKFTQLRTMATEGLPAFTKSTFIPNQGYGDFTRHSQHQRLKHTIAQHLRKLQDNNRCFIIPREQIQGTPGLHLSALHVAYKAADPKGRPCTDANHSGLNEGTDMNAITEFLGDFKLPQLRSLARLLVKAQQQGDTLAHKTDVSAAFNMMLLSPAAALLQTFCIGPWVVIPLVAGFGWCASPAYYNIIASAINWAHNGGISPEQLDQWTRLQGRQPSTRNSDLQDRSLTYVDDSCGRSSYISAEGDMEDLHTIITQLLGPDAYNVKKTEGPASYITIIGWFCDLLNYTIRPSIKGLCKMYYWVFRGLKTDQSIPLHDLQSAVGTLRWYTAVIPLASTHELQQVLSTTQYNLSKQPTNTRPFCRLSKPAIRELTWWRWLLATNLQQDNMLTAPVWFLAGIPGSRQSVHMYTDASGEIGGGYYIPNYSYGQFKWSTQEKTMFGKNLTSTDINALEFVTAICAIIANREHLRHKLIHLHVDNTSAVIWLNKLRTSQDSGQSWIRLLISILLEYDIILDCTYIPGIINVHADALSRYLQTQSIRDLMTSLHNVPLMSTASRLKMWSMSSTPHSKVEYLQILASLEQQD